MFTQDEQTVIRSLALGELETNYSGEGDIGELDLSAIPLHEFDCREDEGTELLRRLQDCQAIVKRLNTSLYTQTNLSFEESDKPDKASDEPKLELATTRELLEEISARIEVGCPEGLDYRTVGHE